MGLLIPVVEWGVCARFYSRADCLEASSSWRTVSVLLIPHDCSSRPPHPQGCCWNEPIYSFGGFYRAPARQVAKVGFPPDTGTVNTSLPLTLDTQDTERQRARVVGGIASPSWRRSFSRLGLSPACWAQGRVSPSHPPSLSPSYLAQSLKLPTTSTPCTSVSQSGLRCSPCPGLQNLLSPHSRTNHIPIALELRIRNTMKQKDMMTGCLGYGPPWA